MKQKMMKAALMLCAALGGLLAAESAYAEETVSDMETVLIGTRFMNDYNQDDYESFGTGHYQTIALDEGGSRQYPQLAETLKAYSEESASSIESDFYTACQDSRSERQEYDHSYQVYSENDILVRRADEQVFSFLSYYSGYTGGAHGYYCYLGHNFDAATGEELTLADLVADEQSLKDLLWQKLLEKYPEGSIGTFNSSLDDYGTGGYDLNFVVDPQGLTFIFNPYEIASYAEGIQIVTIPFDAYPQLFTGRATRATGGYTSHLTGYMGEQYDVDEDGAPEIIDISCTYTDYMQMESMTVSVGQGSCTFDAYGYEMDPVLMHTDDGRVYLYINLSMDNDYHEIHVVNLTGKNPYYEGVIDAGWEITWDDQTELSTMYYPLNPSHFPLGSRMQMLSTYDGMRYYTLDDNSPGSAIGGVFDALRPVSLTTVRELPVYEVSGPAMLAAESPFMLPAGTTVTIRDTDNSTFVDLTLGDGRVVRVYVDTSGYPRTIDGVDENEYFEMLYYAG